MNVAKIKNIRERLFGKNKRCLVVAEISANHGQSFKRAVALIKKARVCGADAVKFQTYTPDTLTIDINNRYFRIKHPKWRGQTLYQLYQKAYTPWIWFKSLKRIAEDLGLIFFSTAFDKTSLGFLDELGVAAHKVASFELVDLPFIEYAARSGKPLIISTGMASLKEITEAVDIAKKAGVKDIVLLKCLSSYPAEPRQMNLLTIPDMRKRFSCPIGLSDHTLGMGVAVAAVSLGAVLVEKHFTLSRQIKTPDTFFSMEPQEFKGLVDNIRIAEQSLGSVSYGLTAQERSSKVFRRSLFAVKDIKQGEAFNQENVRPIRPAGGLMPKCLKMVLGRVAKKDILRGTPLRRGLICQ